MMIRSNPRCAACGNASGRWLCLPCRCDPANDGWSEGEEALAGDGHAASDAAQAAARFTVRGRDGVCRAPSPPVFGDRRARVAELIASGLTDTEVAERVQCSRALARKIRASAVRT